MVSIRKHIQFGALLLALVLFIPMLITATHFLYIHHEHSNISNPNKLELNEATSECPICEYEAVNAIDDQIKLLIGRPELLSTFLTIYEQITFYTHPFYSFNLRAPPVNIHLMRLKKL